MKFAEVERDALLELNGVGPTVLARLEQLGYASFARLAAADASEVVAAASAAVGSTCWRNSPQARAAVGSAIERARRAESTSTTVS